MAFLASVCSQGTGPHNPVIRQAVLDGSFMTIEKLVHNSRSPEQVWREGMLPTRRLFISTFHHENPGGDVHSWLAMEVNPSIGTAVVAGNARRDPPSQPSIWPVSAMPCVCM